jgi:hypothetical protein
VKSATDWDALLRAYGRGTETQVAFCARMGVNVGTFRSRLYRSPRKAEAPSAAPRALVPVASPFVRVDVAEAPALELRLGRTTLRIPAGTDVRYVAALVRAFDAEPC